MECTDDADAASGADPPVPRGARAAYAARAPPGSLLAAARGAHGRAAAAAARLVADMKTQHPGLKSLAV